MTVAPRSKTTLIPLSDDILDAKFVLPSDIVMPALALLKVEAAIAGAKTILPAVAQVTGLLEMLAAKGETGPVFLPPATTVLLRRIGIEPPHHPPAPTPPSNVATTSNPTLADGTDNVMHDPALGFDHVISYSIDGTGNDLADPTRGEAGGDELRIGPANFAPGTTDTPVSGPNPRVISDTIMANDPNNNDPAGRSAYLYAFGQFMDHDLDLTNDQAASAATTLTIPVPANDPYFPAGSSITILRGQIDPANGAAINSVTSYLDLSQVYGSDAATAASLRNPDGTLITSADDDLPVVDGQFEGGDIRVAENPDLTSVDVLFVREHNYWVGQLHLENPALTGDQLYDMARAITTAEYQNIVYNEYLPALLGPDALSTYQGYDPAVSTQIFEEFSTAAFRFGHSIISTTETKIANDGTVLQAQDLIAAASEDTGAFDTFGGADALLRNLAQDTSQQEGVHIVNDLLDMLDANPNDVGDLGAIDVERERDLGIGTLNETRVALGLTAYTSFSQVTSDPTLQAQLQSVYGTVDQLDLFVGGLAEDAAPGAMVGQTFQAIIAMQFDNLRDGDRLYFQNQGFTPAMMQQIEDTSLSDLILRDTDTTAIQANAFASAERHASNVASPDVTLPQLVIGIDADNAVIAATPAVDNTLVAGSGANQVLEGGGSSDRFVFDGTGHVASVVDFAVATDTLDFEDLATPQSVADLVFTRTADGSTVIRAEGDVITLQGVSVGSLSVKNFAFNIDSPALLAQEQLRG